MKITKYRLEFLLRGSFIYVAVVNTVVCNIVQYLVICQERPGLGAVVQKSGIAVMGNAPDPGVERFYFVLFHPVKNVADDLAGQVFRVVPAAQPLAAKAEYGFDVRQDCLFVQVCSSCLGSVFIPVSARYGQVPASTRNLQMSGAWRRANTVFGFLVVCLPFTVSRSSVQCQEAENFRFWKIYP